jgi:hypothetical protein
MTRWVQQQQQEEELHELAQLRVTCYKDADLQVVIGLLSWLHSSSMQQQQQYWF